MSPNPFRQGVLGSALFSALLHVSSFSQTGSRDSQEHKTSSSYPWREHLCLQSFSEKEAHPSGPHGLGLPIFDPAIVKEDGTSIFSLKYVLLKLKKLSSPEPPSFLPLSSHCQAGEALSQCSIKHLPMRQQQMPAISNLTLGTFAQVNYITLCY